MKLKVLTFVIAVLWWAIAPAAAQSSRIAIEELMRRVQARKVIPGGTPYPWPCCWESPSSCTIAYSCSAPEYPPDGYYRIDTDDCAVALLREVVPKIGALMLSFIREDCVADMSGGTSEFPCTQHYDGTEAVFADLMEYFGNASLITTSNYRTVFALASEAVDRLRYIPLTGGSPWTIMNDAESAAGGNLVEFLCGPSQPANGQTCSECFAYVLSLFDQQWQWGTASAPLESFGVRRDNGACITPEGDLYLSNYGITSTRIRWTVGGSHNRGSLHLFARAIPFTCGTIGGAPIPTDEKYYKLWTGSLSGEVSPWFADFRPPTPSPCSTPCDPAPCAVSGWKIELWVDNMPPGYPVVTPVIEPDFYMPASCPVCQTGSQNVNPGDGRQQQPRPKADKEKADCDKQTGGNPQSPNPVYLATGLKHETAIDLVVPAVGRSFALKREYTSDTNYISYSNGGAKGGLIGKGWTSPVFQFLKVEEVQNTTRVTLRGRTIDEEFEFNEAQGSNPPVWKTGGSSTWFVKRGVVIIDDVQWPVWRLVEPGQGEWDFYRDVQTFPATEIDGYYTQLKTDEPELFGMLIQERNEYPGEVDTHGSPLSREGNFWTYRYLIVGPNAQDRNARLCCIHINGTPQLPGAAEVWFYWHLDSASPFNGQLDYVEVRRRPTGSISTSPAMVQKVDYLYKLNGDDYSNSVGTQGDLIQVTVAEGVDRAPEDVDPVWVRVTQYRYHGAWSGNGDERLTVTGASHQLKSVINTEQVEFFAQRTTAGTVADGAAALLLLDDDAVPWTNSGLQVVDLASKIVSYTGNRVAAQFIQSSCGCGGGATQGLKEQFEYLTWMSGSIAGVTTRISEYTGSGTYTQLHRVNTFDMEFLDGGTEPYLINRAIFPGTETAHKWVWHYKFTPNTRNLEKMYMPSACEVYSEAAGGNPPSYQAHDNQGLVYGYVYTTQHRQQEERLANGDIGSVSSFLLRRKTEFNVPNDAFGYLPSKIEEFRVADNSPPTDPDLIETTTFTYGFLNPVGTASNGRALTSVKTSVERERESENGPGGTDTYDSFEFFDSRGLNVESRTADGVSTFREFDDNTGRVSASTRGGLTTTFAHDLLGRMTERVSPGGVRSSIRREVRSDPDPNRSGILYLAETVLPHALSSSTFDGPAFVTWYNGAYRATRVSQYEIDVGEPYAPPLTFTLDTEIARSTTQHHVSGLIQSQTAWHNVAGNSYATTQFSYDALGRVKETTSPTGTVSRNAEYDVLNRVLKVEVGTDTNPTTGNMVLVAEYFYDGGGAASQGVGDGQVTLIRQFTGEEGAAALSAAYRDTKRTIDFRGRVVMIERTGPSQATPPHEFVVYDNLDRIIQRGLYSSVPSGIGGVEDSARGLYAESRYSQRGLMYRQRIAINSTDLDDGFLETNQWFDAEGRSIEEWAPNSPAIKRSYDALGRVTTMWLTERGQDPAPGQTGGYTHADDVNDDQVVEQTDFSYGSPDGPWPGRLLLITTRRRNHDTTSTGALNSNNSVASYVAHYYDAAMRRTHTVDFGANSSADVFQNGAAPTWPPSPLEPPSFATTGRNVSAIEFNSRGLVARAIDPKEQRTEYRYDDLSRRFAVIENAQGVTGSLSISWNPTSEVWEVSGLSPSSPDQNRVTTFVYDASGNTTKQIAHTSNSSSQVTLYSYGTQSTLGSPSTDTHSLVASTDLLREVAYPDESSGQPGIGNTYKVSYSYNRLGELRTVVDQNQTKHTYERDALGRVLRDTPAFASGSGIDDAIKRIAVSYDNFGRLETVKSYSAIGATNTTVRNEVEFAYTKLWQVSNVYQDVNGEVEYNGSGVPIGDTILVSYGYANSAAPTAGSAAANFSRLTSMTYPNGNVVNYGYGTAGGLDDRISRARSLADPGDSDNIVEYSRVGLDFFAIVDYPLADVQLDRTFSRNGQRSMWSTQGTGVYPGWDRHGRVSIHAWMDGGLDEGTNGLPTRPPIVDEGYAYDKSSNRLTKYDMRPGAPTSTNPDWQFTYDGLDRLTEAKKGDRNASTFATGFGSHKWVLDVLGNWVKHHKELDGTNPYGGTGETEDRTHNAANEITNRYPNGSSSSPTLPFAYDHAGNLKQENYSAGQNHVFKHDAWNRLVKHEFGGSPAPTYPVNAEYEYNGLHWRTIKRIPPQSPAAEEEQQQGVPGVLRSMYYSAAWQLIEERIDEDYTGSPGVNRIAQEVWGLRYIDDAVMRIPEVGDGPPRFYHLTDVQFSTVSMIGLGGTYAPLVERVGYDPYGRATHRWEGDVNNDGAFDDTDRNLIKDAAGTGYSLGDSGYDVRMDLDRDGDVDNDDKDIAYAMGDAAALAPGEISGRGAGNVDNIFGYDGYVFAPENQRYCVRFRWYDPATGRWMERDPAGYVGGASLYEAVRSHPMATDPLGLWCRRGDTLVAEQGDTLASLMKLLNMPLRGFFSSLSIFNTPIPPGTQLQTSLLTDALAHELGASSMRLLNAIRSAAAHCGGDDDELRLLIDQLSAELNFALKVGAAVSDSLGDAARGAADAIYSAWDHRGIPAHEMDEMWKQNGRAARLLMLSWAARTGSTLLDVRQLYEAIRSGDFRAIIAPLSSLGAAAADIALRKLKSPTAVIRRANLVLAAGEVLASGIEIWSVGSELSAQKAQRRSVCDRLKKAMPGLAERQNQAFQQYMSLQVALDRIPCCKEDQIGPNVD